ncbi:MAG: hypothetical protein JWR12_2951 [Mucilaginibacter sp.]|jgi:hypothetical protein|nr:hypothetical protein [Mucilaginibacter sp.]
MNLINNSIHPDVYQFKNLFGVTVTDLQAAGLLYAN